MVRHYRRKTQPVAITNVQLQTIKDRIITGENRRSLAVEYVRVAESTIRNYLKKVTLLHVRAQHTTDM